MALGHLAKRRPSSGWGIGREDGIARPTAGLGAEVDTRRPTWRPRFSAARAQMFAALRPPLPASGHPGTVATDRQATPCWPRAGCVPFAQVGRFLRSRAGPWRRGRPASVWAPTDSLPWSVMCKIFTVGASRCHVQARKPCDHDLRRTLPPAANRSYAAWPRLRAGTSRRRRRSSHLFRAE